MRPAVRIIFAPIMSRSKRDRERGYYVHGTTQNRTITIDPRSSAVRALGCPETLWANGAVYVYAPHFAFSAR